MYRILQQLIKPRAWRFFVPVFSFGETRGRVFPLLLFDHLRADELGGKTVMNKEIVAAMSGFD